MHSTDDCPKPFGESAEEFFAKSGVMPTKYDDVRQFPRFYYRACAGAVIHPLGAGQPASARTIVLTRNLSRSGVSLIYHAQLFPGQKIDLMFDGKPTIQATVAWCRRIAEKRYAIGCRFLPQGDQKAAETSG